MFMKRSVLTFTRRRAKMRQKRVRQVQQEKRETRRKDAARDKPE